MKKQKRFYRIIAILLMVAMVLNSNTVINAMEAESATTEEVTEPGNPEETKESETMEETQRPVEETQQPTEETQRPTEETQGPEGTLSGMISYSDHTAIPGIVVRLYDKTTYVYDDPNTQTREDEQNNPLYEAVSQADGSYQLNQLAAGEYRVEYIDQNGAGELAAAEFVPVKTERYEVMPGQDGYLAYIDTIQIEDQETIDISFIKAAAETEAISEPMTDPETDPETEPAKEAKIAAETAAQPETEETSESESKPLTVADLENADEDVAMAVVEKPDGKKDTKKARTGDNWQFNAHYVGERDSNHITKTDDFKLKYQMEFNASIGLEPGQLEIRIPRALLEYRNGTKIYPADIAVARGSMEEPAVSANPLNYYLDGEDMVFFNYTEVEAGTNIAFQVLYKNLNVMNIVDETTWSLEPTVTVKDETVKAKPLSGQVDTWVQLTGVTKTPYKRVGKSYTPGLYTENQINNYVSGGIPEPYKSNFKDYRFVVWEITVRGNATQHWDLYLKDTATVKDGAGELVGYNVGSGGGPIAEGPYAQYQQIVKNSGSRSCGTVVYAVTAYPAAAGIEPGTLLENNIDVILHPYDNIDEDQYRSAEGSWPYADYQWKYAGDQTSLSKQNVGGSPNWKEYPGWLDVYEIASRQQEDKGELDFSISSSYRGFDNVMHTSGAQLGQVKEGNSYKLITADEEVYAYADGKSGEKVLLDSDDYYFSYISLNRSDTGYDIWEDTETAPEQGGNLVIYAWYKDSSDWEVVETIPWSGSTMSYSFTPEQLAREPWRVKAEQESAGYSTSCNIRLKLMIRSDSPKIAALREGNPDLKELVIENSANNYGIGLSKTEDDNNFKPIIKRTSTQARLLKSKQRAFSQKTGSAVNDPTNERVNVKYAIGAYDGYQIYSRDAANYLKENGVKSPGRNAVVFYDLLPYGVRFDASVPIVAGRITRSTSYITRPGDWDTAQVTATVDPQTDIIINYRNTGRTMVAIHLTYEGADPATYIDRMWLEGFGVSFGAYYSWKDLGIVNNAPNISAFMPEAGDHNPLLGTTNEVFCDNGELPAALKADYKYFGANINGDPTDDDIPRVLYARAAVNEDVAVYSKYEVNKLVRADSDKYGPYVKSTDVEKGGTYTYDITVSTAAGVLEDIVVYDILEYAPKLEAEFDSEGHEDNWWYGEFKGVTTTALERLGISPIIYYHADRETAKAQSGASIDPADVLIPENGWIKAEEWGERDLKDVQAVAVDLTWSTTEGQKYQLESMKNLSLQINMAAPENVADGASYAYNNAIVYAKELIQGPNLEGGKAVKVRLSEPGKIEVTKEFSGEIPDAVQAWSFLFRAYSIEGDSQAAYANKGYELYKRGIDDEWIKQSGLYATNAQGEFYLEADQKAIFSDSLKAADLRIEEEQNPFWKVAMEEHGEADNRSLVFKNSYQSVLYVQKRLAAVPTEQMEAVKDSEFTFQLLIGDQPAGDTEFLYVDRPRTDGGIPNILGSGKTDEEGRFTIKQGENLAFSQDPQSEYAVKEIDGYGEGTDWICEQPEISGTIPQRGTVATITNTYRWKSLHLTKEIINQSADQVSQEFTFQIQDQNGVPLTSENRYVVKGGGSIYEEGNLDENGSLSSVCAGKTICIEGLEARKTYRIHETESGADYQAVNDLIEVTMPLHSEFITATITNDYLMRPLSVTKEVIYDPEDEEVQNELKEKEFTMTAQINGQPLAEHDYVLSDSSWGNQYLKTGVDGSFTLKHGQTATFAEAGKRGERYVITESPDPDYYQMTPANNEPHQGVIPNEGVAVTFVNGSGESGSQLIIGKDYVAAADDLYGNSQGYVENSKTDKWMQELLAVTVTLEIKDGNRTFIWPEKDTRVSVLDPLDNSVSYVTWKAGSSLTVEPWKRVTIKNLEADWEYTLSESAADQNRIVNLDQYQSHHYISLTAEIKAQTGVVSGKTAANPTAILRNEMKVRYANYPVRKRMTMDSAEVPEGARLVWRVEKLDYERYVQSDYTDNVWSPAAGIEYLTVNGEGLNTNEVLKTGSDGKIILTKTKGGYPGVNFFDTPVQVGEFDYTGYEYRVVEVPEESDDDWGYLAGYSSYGSPYYYYQMSGGGNIFVNSNRYMPVEIEKTMAAPSDETFTMLLRQVVLAYGSGDYGIPVQEEEIQSSIAGVNIPYTVHDSVTGQEIGSGVTTGKGEIKLKAGQYARINLPEESLWTVSEQNRQPYTLREMTGSPESKLTKLNDNLMLIYQAAESGREEIDPEEFDEITLTKEMIDNGGVFSYHGGYSLNFDARHLYIQEEYIVYQNRGYKITAIGDDAFRNKTRAEYIYLPHSITSIGKGAFSGCSRLNSVSLPQSLMEIGEGAFRDCSSLTYFYTSENLTDIGAEAFRGCSSLTYIELQQNLNTIGTNAFADCDELREIYINKRQDEIDGAPWGANNATIYWTE